MEIKRRLNMAISRKDYINECHNLCRIWIEHVIKLIAFNSPEDENNWKNSVYKGFECETFVKSGKWEKPIREHMNLITNEDGIIDDNSLSTIVYGVTHDERYLNLPRKSKFNLEYLKSAIYELLSMFSVTKRLTKDEVHTIINNWYNKYR
jgi:hypothetical protein